MIMDDYSKKAIVEIVDTAREYASKLEELIKAVDGAEEQVNSSAQTTLLNIDNSFELITSAVVEALHKRKNELTREVLRIKEDGLKPLRECREIILEKLKCTQNYIEEGRTIFKISGKKGVEERLRFSEKASELGSLPAVPTLEEVPDISFQCPVDSVKSEFVHSIARLGEVSRMGPVQITDVEEKPGAVLVHWEEVDFERVVDVHSFRLQMAYGDVRGEMNLLEGNFHDMYIGPECQHLVRDLQPGVPYTFRVCCRVEGDSEWSAWSLPRVAITNHEPFCWDESNPNYQITNEKKIAKKITSDLSVLFSGVPQFGPGHSIEFTVLECGTGLSDEGLGLVNQRVEGENLLQPGALFVNSQGCVFVDGREKTTKLPRLEKGSKVSFTCEHIRENKIRVNIDSNNKSVTYDWNISSPDLKLYFAICFGESGWKILVE